MTRPALPLSKVCTTPWTWHHQCLLPCIALEDTLTRFSGAMILLSNRLSSLDTILVRLIPQISFPVPTPEAVGRVFKTYLDRVEVPPSNLIESKQDLVQWVVTAVRMLGLSVRDAWAIFDAARERAATQNWRPIGLKDMIQAYTEKTGRPNEWDLVTDLSPYIDVPGPEGSLTPEIEQLLLDNFGPASGIPNDGRLELTFSKSFHSRIPRDFSFKLITALGSATEELRRVGGGIEIVDWAWPTGLWTPTEGQVYRLRPPTYQEPAVPTELSQRRAYLPQSLGGTETTQRQWEEGETTLGPRPLVSGSHKPWRRLL